MSSAPQLTVLAVDLRAHDRADLDDDVVAGDLHRTSFRRETVLRDGTREDGVEVRVCIGEHVGSASGLKDGLPRIWFHHLDSHPAIRVTIENRAHSLPPSGKVFIAIKIGMAQNSPNMQWLI